MYLHTATIRGAGVFPLDMLRYDACFPNTQEDVAALDASLQHETRNYAVTVCRISRSKTDRFTEARWASFSAEVTSVQVRKL